MCGRVDIWKDSGLRQKGRREGSQLCWICLVFGGLGGKKRMIKQKLIKQMHKQVGVYVICKLRAGVISEERIAFWELEECTLPSFLIQGQICLGLPTGYVKGGA